jgi:hypothetical protein
LHLRHQRGLFEPARVARDASIRLSSGGITTGPAAAVDKPLYLLAPALALLPAFTTFIVIPFGPDLTIGGHLIRLVIACLFPLPPLPT